MISSGMCAVRMIKASALFSVGIFPDVHSAAFEHAVDLLVGIADFLQNLAALLTDERSRAGSEVVTCELDIHRDPPPQYGSENYIDSMSMRKTRFLQRRPGVYSLLSEQTEDLPLYARYFPGAQKKTERNA